MSKSSLTRLSLTVITIICLLVLRASGAATPQTVHCPAVRHGVAFLATLYNPSVGLLRESPEIAPHNHWLTTDNVLAARALSALGERRLSKTLNANVRLLGYTGHTYNGLVEALWGTPVEWPPHVEHPITVARRGPDAVLQESRDDGPRFEDWAEYANLAFLGALNEYNHGRQENAQAIFQRAMKLFDGTGFRDKAYETGHGYYETYKLALALIAGTKIAAPMDDLGPTLLTALLQKQAPPGHPTYGGGFYTLYGPTGPVGDPNTETTAFALLALHAYGCQQRQLSRRAPPN